MQRRSLGVSTSTSTAESPTWCLVTETPGPGLERNPIAIRTMGSVSLLNGMDEAPSAGVRNSGATAAIAFRNAA